MRRAICLAACGCLAFLSATQTLYAQSSATAPSVAASQAVASTTGAVPATTASAASAASAYDNCANASGNCARTTVNALTLGKTAAGTEVNLHVINDVRALQDSSADDILVKLGKEFLWPLTLIIVLMTIISTTISYVAGERTASAARVNLLATCQRSYSDIASELFDLHLAYKKQKDVGPVSLEWIEEMQFKARKVLTRLWSLQHAQYLYFEEGLIKPKVFKSWLEFRHMEYRSTNRYNFEGVTFRETWEEYRSYLRSTSRFRELMEAAMETDKPDQAGDPHGACIAAMMKYLTLHHPRLSTRLKWRLYAWWKNRAKAQ
ncbi:hypothetical protein [Caballeronia sp. LZ035]|uniref:hypothetical protein n=1 Tax=Caballeronia sp. LZ035 TaxID=3038568 RepID=UPI002866EEA4|nr:hypothetical protein [Caballeronia sp. LZ035]MDR5760987.1 hypothetical protein [Caballeronia sp. LZ035]